MMQPVSVLPSQYFEARGKQAPEHRLMLAVLHDALDCVNNTHGRRLFREAQQWFRTDDKDWLYSFERICEFLDLDSNAIRQHLGLAPTRQPARVSREMHIARHESCNSCNC